MMNKNVKLLSYLLSAGAIAGALTFTSCSDEEEIESIRPEVELPEQFSTLTAEQNKQKLEDEGLKLVQNMKELKDSKAVDGAVSFNHFASVASIPDGGRVSTNKAVKMFMLLGQFGIGQKSATDLLRGFRTKTDGEPHTARELFDDVKGIYTYSAANNTWTWTASPDRIVFRFPSTETGTVNNAEFAVYGYQSVNVVNNEAEYNGDLPTALKADLTVAGQKVMEYSWTAAYKSNGEPTSVSTSLSLAPFKIQVDMKNTTSEVSVDYSLTENNVNIIALGAGASGSFTTDSSPESAGDVVKDASAYLQVMNIRLAGKMDVAALDNATQNATTTAQEAAALNTHSDFVVFYADSKQKIAEVEFFGAVEQRSYQSCYFNQMGQYFCETVFYTDEFVDARLVFADKSKVDLETYAGDAAFADLEQEITDLLNEIEADLD